MLTQHTERCGKPPGAPVRYRAPHARAVVRRRATANAAAGEPGPLYEHFQGIVSALDDRALQRAALQGREAWLTDAIEQPIICASTGANIHLLGVVHDAPGNVHDICLAAQAIQPGAVIIESTPCQVPEHLSLARDWSSHLAELSSHPAAHHADTRLALPGLDPSGEFATDLARLSAKRREALQRAAARRQQGAGQGAAVVSGAAMQGRQGRGEGGGVDKRALRSVLLSGCAVMTEELGAAYAALQLDAPLMGIDLPPADLSELLRRTGILTALDTLLREIANTPHATPYRTPTPSPSRAARGAMHPVDALITLWALYDWSQCITSESSASNSYWVRDQLGVLQGVGSGGQRWDGTLPAGAVAEPWQAAALAEAAAAAAAGDTRRAVRVLLTALPPSVRAAIDDHIAAWRRVCVSDPLSHAPPASMLAEQKLIDCILTDHGVSLDLLTQATSLSHGHTVASHFSPTASTDSEMSDNNDMDVLNRYCMDWFWKHGEAESTSHGSGSHMHSGFVSDGLHGSAKGLHGGSVGSAGGLHGDGRRSEKSLYARLQCHASPSMLLRSLSNQINLMRAVALTPDDMCEVTDAVPKVTDAVLIRPRDAHMARRIAAVCRNRARRARRAGLRGGSGRAKNVLVVLGRAHVRGVRDALSGL